MFTNVTDKQTTTNVSRKLPPLPVIGGIFNKRKYAKENIYDLVSPRGQWPLLRVTSNVFKCIRTMMGKRKDLMAPSLFLSFSEEQLKHYCSCTMMSLCIKALITRGQLSNPLSTVSSYFWSWSRIPSSHSHTESDEVIWAHIYKTNRAYSTIMCWSAIYVTTRTWHWH